MKSMKYQRGLSSISWLLVLMVLAFLALFAAKAVPPYVENQYVVEALKSLSENNKDLSNLTAGEIRTQLSKFFTINGVRGEAGKHVEIKQTRDGVVVNINYEVRENLFRHIDLVSRFDNQLNSKYPERCCQPVTEDEQ
jgi:Tfp pilus assembly major pilin PilA